ncbi:MAG: RloB domain-containing protein [Phascolarctobacterium sp.]|nr:RloB domain-containing protein [Phascolarctobacterium sp.]
MPNLSTRQEVSLVRKSRPASNKIIFISCEGQVTEEEYFKILTTIFDGVKSKLCFVSVMGDILAIPTNQRTTEQCSLLGKSKPWQLVEKIETFKIEQDEKYEFSKHPDDEFWIIADVDDNTNNINLERWNEVFANREAKSYQCAISNPFFEVWLLLHHVDIVDEDFKYAVTDSQEYKATAHFRERLRNDAHAPLKNQKHLNEIHYDIDKVRCAVQRAKQLDNAHEEWPHNLGSTVYLLVEKLIDIEDSMK